MNRVAHRSDQNLCFEIGKLLVNFDHIGDQPLHQLGEQRTLLEVALAAPGPSLIEVREEYFTA